MLDDSVAQREFGNARVMLGRKGTVFAEDIRGLHRGSPAAEGKHRIILQLAYATSLYAGWDGRVLPLTRLPTALQPMVGLMTGLDGLFAYCFLFEGCRAPTVVPGHCRWQLL